MSGICGIVSLDGKAVTRPELARLVTSLERRGPDGSNLWLNGPVGLGHTLLATTPEALVEKLPLTHDATGCTITADVRLDNRDELFSDLGLSEADRVVGDGELILLAYLNWGESCLDHLLGDFAFAIWDPREHKLFCARDQIGMRQLIYSIKDQDGFVFSTEVNSILNFDGVKKKINLERVADFFIGNSAVDKFSTFFENIFRLPPAHKLIFQNGQFSVERYWNLNTRPELKIATEAEWINAFLKVFKEAVRCRLRGGHLVGVMLSGGIDSGSIAAVAQQLLDEAGEGPLKTFSAAGPDPGLCVETRMIHLACQSRGLGPVLIDLSDIESIREPLTALTTNMADPFDGPMALPRALYIVAHQAGVKALLDGVAGDLVFDPGDILAALIKDGRPISALREAYAQSRFWGAEYRAFRAWARALWNALSPAWLRRVREALREPRRERLALQTALIHPLLARRGGFAARLRKLRAAIMVEGLAEQEARSMILTHPYLVQGRECYDRIASASAIEPRDPFADRRVLEFLLSVPAKHLESDGWPKRLLRQAMAGYLTDAIRWRRGKEHLGWEFNKRFFEVCDYPYSHIDDLMLRLKGVVNEDEARKALGLLASDEELERFFYLRYFATWADVQKIDVLSA